MKMSILSILLLASHETEAVPPSLGALTFSVAQMVAKDSPTRGQGDASCLGLLVGEDLLATAGHCLEERDCPSTAWAFPRRPGDGEETLLGCLDLVERQDDEGLEGERDYALVRLDGKAQGRRAFEVRQSGRVGPRAKLLALGIRGAIFPGPIVRNNQDYMFYAKLEAPFGSSGGPVIDAHTGKVEGILVTRTRLFATDTVLSGVSRITNIKALREERGFVDYLEYLFSSMHR